jgi:hypothetical protein
MFDQCLINLVGSNSAPATFKFASLHFLEEYVAVHQVEIVIRCIMGDDSIRPLIS